jgi:anti-sigma factor RsiW
MELCAEFKDDLSAYIDGQLDPDRQSQVDEHIGSCNKCSDEHQRLREVVRIFALSNLAASARCPDIWSQVQLRLPSVCEVVQEDFSAYLDGELIVPAKEGVSEHLQTCSDCHTRFQDLSRVNSLLSRGLTLSETVEIDIWSAVKSRLDEDCQLIRDELSCFYDREVTPQRHRAITAHLLECSDCRDQLALITQTGDLLRNSYQPDIDESFDLWPEIKAKMNTVQFGPREKRRKESVNRRILYAVAAVFVGGAVAGATLFLGPGPGTLKPVTAEAYLIESALGEPADMAEAMVYENQ